MKLWIVEIKYEKEKFHLPHPEMLISIRDDYRHPFFQILFANYTFFLQICEKEFRTKQYRSECGTYWRLGRSAETNLKYCFFGPMYGTEQTLEQTATFN